MTLVNKFTEQIILLADLMADAGVDPEVALVSPIDRAELNGLWYITRLGDKPDIYVKVHPFISAGTIYVCSMDVLRDLNYSADGGKSFLEALGA